MVAALQSEFASGLTYMRSEPRGSSLGALAEAILAPSKTIAQGFATNVFELDDGRSVTGFVVKESAEGVVLRDAEGKEHALSLPQFVRQAELEHRLQHVQRA